MKYIHPSGKIQFAPLQGTQGNFRNGAFDADGGFRVPPPVSRKILEPWFRKKVLALLRREGLVSAALAEKMLAWRHTGFSAHNSVLVRANDGAGALPFVSWVVGFIFWSPSLKG